MRIGDLAKHGNCDVETVRFYEREGLLEEPAREINGYRCYTDAHVVQLKFIRHCRSLGIGLSDVRMLRRFRGDPDMTCDEINHLIDSHIERIHQQIESLHLVEQQLHRLRNTCGSNQLACDCGILRNLKLAAEDKTVSAIENGMARTERC